MLSAGGRSIDGGFRETSGGLYSGIVVVVVVVVSGTVVGIETIVSGTVVVVWTIVVFAGVVVVGVQLGFSG